MQRQNKNFAARVKKDESARVAAFVQLVHGRRATEHFLDKGDAARNLLDCIEKNLDPVSNVYDARAATEMIVAVFESHRLGGPVVFPLENRKNPLSML